MKSEIENRAKFDTVRYAQVWEDADLLIEALAVTPDDTVLSIASAGDNAFALLAQNPKRVYAADLSFSQIACCELRKAMYRQLSHSDHLLFGGVIHGQMDRAAVFDSLELPAEIRAHWKQNMALIQKGFMTQGKFERYFTLFRKRILPLIHTKKTIAKLAQKKSREERLRFYEDVWNNRRWRVLFKLFFSRRSMGRFGRDKEFFAFVEGSVADRILARSKHALTELDTSQNPYLHFILFGTYPSILPYALREEHYETIRRNLDRIEFCQISVETFIAEFEGQIHAFNLSDIFEYMTQESMDTLYQAMLKKASCGARFAYWNMLAPRKGDAGLGLATDENANAEYLARDKAFFYSRFTLDTARAEDSRV